jgi:hypothetical protein
MAYVELVDRPVVEATEAGEVYKKKIIFAMLPIHHL